MSLVVSKTRLLYGAASASAIIGGVVLKNTFENSDGPINSLLSKGGAVSFTVGWIGLAFAVAMSNRGSMRLNLRSILPFLAAFLIVSGVMGMKMLPDYKAKFLPLFVGGWGLFGISLHLRGYGPTTLVVSGVVGVLVSMIGMLPQQRIRCMVDGPGMPLFTGSLAALVLSNAIV